LIADAADAKAVRNALVRSSDGLFHVDWVRSRADGLVRLARGGTANVAAVLADLDLPDSSGLDTFAQLHGAAPSSAPRRFFYSSLSHLERFPIDILKISIRRS